MSQGDNSPEVPIDGHGGGKRGDWRSVPGFGVVPGPMSGVAWQPGHMPPLVFSWPKGDLGVGANTE